MILELDTPPKTVAAPTTRTKFIQKLLDHSSHISQAVPKKKEDPFEEYFSSNCEHDVVLVYHKKKLREAFQAGFLQRE